MKPARKRPIRPTCRTRQTPVTRSRGEKPSCRPVRASAHLYTVRESPQERRPERLAPGITEVSRVEALRRLLAATDTLPKRVPSLTRKETFWQRVRRWMR